MSAEEEKRFASACEDGDLCDPQYCPYMRGETSRLGEAWERYCEQMGGEN